MFSTNQLTGKIANSSRYTGHDSEKTRDLRRQLKEVKLANYITKIIAEAPPLNQEQVDRLAALLRAD